MIVVRYRLGLRTERKKKNYSEITQEIPLLILANISSESVQQNHLGLDIV